MYQLPIILLCFWGYLLYAQPADLIIVNAEVYTVDEDNPMAEAIAIRDGKILQVGSNEDIRAIGGKEVLDAEGSFVMPGFIEGHGHFSSLGYSLIDINLLDTKSWEEVVDAVADQVAETPAGEWIVGRGWHQEKWTKTPERNVLGYPTHHDLSELSPDHPVYLKHASGHGLLANRAAMQLAGISAETPDPIGGEIVRDASGEAIGIFEEEAMALISDRYDEWESTQGQAGVLAKWYRAVRLAQEECLRKGITSFQDAGSTFAEADRYFAMAEKGKLDLRLWFMIRHSSGEMEGRLVNYRRVDVGDGFATCRAIKSEIDGALGSFGAWLLEPYEDKPGFSGQNTTGLSEVKAIAELAYRHDMQLCVHSIGDRANRLCLDLFEDMFRRHPEKTDWRWRVEHAQHLSKEDIPRFAALGVIASIQGVHCTSDAPFVEKRLGTERARTGAYAWRSLLDSGARIANGTDAPVEDVDPLKSIYASVSRKRLDNGMEFFPEQAMTREEALYSYTLGNARAAFEEKRKGSIEPGKYADLVILDTNLRTCKDIEIPEARILYTIVGGEIKYKDGRRK